MKAMAAVEPPEEQGDRQLDAASMPPVDLHEEDRAHGTRQECEAEHGEALERARQLVGEGKDQGREDDHGRDP